MPSRPAIAARCTMPLVEPPIASSMRSAFSNAAGVMIRSGVRRSFASATARAPVASAFRMRSAITAGMQAPPGSIMPSASVHSAMVEAVPITMQVPADGQSWALTALISRSSISPARNLRPVAAAVGAGAEPLALVVAGDHRPGHHQDRRHVGARRAHQQRRHRLVAAADQHHRIQRLRADHLLGVHRHQVAQVHAGRIRERLVQRDRRELDRQPAREHDAALHRLDQLGNGAVAGVEAAEGVGDADDGPLERVVGIAHRLDEGLAQEQRKLLVAVRREALAHSRLRFHLRHRNIPPWCFGLRDSSLVSRFWFLVTAEAGTITSVPRKEQEQRVTMLMHTWACVPRARASP